MDTEKPSHLITFSMVCGVVVWGFGIFWSALFIVAVPMDSDWCVEAKEVLVEPDGVDMQCTVFKNSLEEAKYNHNIVMRERNARWVYAVLGIGALLGVAAFSTIPKLRGKDVAPACVPTGAILGLLSALFVPLLLSSLLPPPVMWMPADFREIAEIRVQNALLEIRAATAAQSEKTR